MLECVSRRYGSIKSRHILGSLRGLTISHVVAAQAPRLSADADAEPLHLYRPGGYHPIRLGDTFNHGRYKVAHKLGWGGYSTVWLAKDFDQQRLVALKILTADCSNDPREASILRTLINGRTETIHTTSLLDQFTCTGPNGEHAALVFDVAGTSVQSQCARYSDRRLPANAAWMISKQIAEALSVLHKMKVCHGDLHTGNIMLCPFDGSLSDPDLLKRLAAPYRADIRAGPSTPLTASIPPYIVEPVCLPSIPLNFNKWTAKIVDFGQSFIVGEPLQPVRCPLVFRAPETLLDTTWDRRIDIWSFACTMFELITGQTPFSGMEASKDSLKDEWMATFGPFPAEWRDQQPTLRSDQMDQSSLADWLHDCYFETEVEKKIELAEEHIEWLGDLLTQMMRYRPEERLSMDEVLRHRWFLKNPLEP